MPMSEDERRELGELETRLSRQPRLVKLARRLSSASVDTGLRRTSVLWGAGGAVGLSLVVTGAAAHSSVRDLGCVLGGCSRESGFPLILYVPVAPSVAPRRVCRICAWQPPGFRSWSLRVAPPPHRTDCCRFIRRKGGVKG
jgi:hypothetical protein